MEIKIGIQNVAREVTLESNETADAITQKFTEAITSGGLLSLQDEKGRTVMVPATAIGYLDLGTEHVRRVGFGALG